MRRGLAFWLIVLEQNAGVRALWITHVIASYVPITQCDWRCWRAPSLGQVGQEFERFTWHPAAMLAAVGAALWRACASRKRALRPSFRSGWPTNFGKPGWARPSVRQRIADLFIPSQADRTGRLERYFMRLSWRDAGVPPILPPRR